MDSPTPTCRNMHLKNQTDLEEQFAKWQLQLFEASEDVTSSTGYIKLLENVYHPIGEFERDPKYPL